MSAAPRWFREAVSREAALAVALTLFAGGLRLWDLGDTPYGMIGDEANVVIDSQRILRDGWIGAWSGTALGYPIAVNYLVALSIKLFGVEVFSARLPVALAGTAAIPLAYYVGRNVGGWRVGLCGALLLSVSLWHLHLSRVALPVGVWPTVELVALLSLQLGLRDRRWPYFLLAGLATGVSIWVYPTASVFMLAMGGYVAGWAIVEFARTRAFRPVEIAVLIPIAAAAAYLLARRSVDVPGSGWLDPLAAVSLVAAGVPLAAWLFARIIERGDNRTARTLMLLAILAASTYIAAKPMIDVADLPGDPLDNRFQQVYVFSERLRERCEPVPPDKRDPDCRNAVADSTSQKLDVMRNRMQRLYMSLVVDAPIDPSDGLGTRPPLGKYLAYLAMAGAVVAIVSRRYRREAVVIGIAVIAGLFLSVALTRAGELRRGLGALPFLTLYAGIALAVAWEWAARQRVVVHAAVLALVAFAIGAVAYGGAVYYFRDYEDDPFTAFSFSPASREAWEHIDTLGHPYVYYYNKRARVTYSTNILAPDMAGGEDRSTEFTTEEDRTEPRLDLRPSAGPALTLTRQPDGAVFVFIEAYAVLFDQVRARYPGGIETSSYNDTFDVWNFRAYYLPAPLLDEYLRAEGVSYTLAEDEAPP